MRILHSLALVVALSATLPGCDTPRVGDPEPITEGEDLVKRGTSALTAAQIEIFLGGSTLRHQGEDYVWHVYLRDDGVLIGHALEKKTKGIEISRGTWEAVDGTKGAKEGQLCRMWDSDWAGGLKGCATVYRYGKEYVFVPVGTADPGEGDDREKRRTRLPGNPLEL